MTRRLRSDRLPAAQLVRDPRSRTPRSRRSSAAQRTITSGTRTTSAIAAAIPLPSSTAAPAAAAISRGPDFRSGFWLPPVTGGVCILTGRAVNSDGLSSTLSAAVLVRPGTTAVTQPPQIGVQLDNGCFIVAPSPSVDCGFAEAGAQRAVFGSVGWGNGKPGSVTISDDCVGAQPEPPNTSNFSAFWTIPPSPGGCTVTVRATNLQGVHTDAVAFYRVSGP